MKIRENGTLINHFLYIRTDQRHGYSFEPEIYTPCKQN